MSEADKLVKGPQSHPAQGGGLGWQLCSFAATLPTALRNSLREGGISEAETHRSGFQCC